LSGVTRGEPEWLALVGDLRDRDRREREVQGIERAQPVLARDRERPRLDLLVGCRDDLDPARRMTEIGVESRERLAFDDRTPGARGADDRCRDLYVLA
jgi:hypothetical protein